MQPVVTGQAWYQVPDSWCELLKQAAAVQPRCSVKLRCIRAIASRNFASLEGLEGATI